MLTLTFAVLALVTGALVLLRLRWPHLSSKIHKIVITCACAALVLYAFTFVSGWSTSSRHVNAAIYWFAIAGYEFFLLLFTLLRPRWLTVAITIVLLFPLLSASPFLPLSELFNPAPHTIVSLGSNLTSDRNPWGTGAGGSSGVELDIYSHPSWTRFLRRRRQGARYYNSQCDGSRATATLLPDRRHVLMSCPAAPGQQADTARNLVVKLY